MTPTLAANMSCFPPRKNALLYLDTLMRFAVPTAGWEVRANLSFAMRHSARAGYVHRENDEGTVAVTRASSEKPLPTTVNWWEPGRADTHFFEQLSNRLRDWV